MSSFLYTGLDAISSNLDDVLSINPFAYVFFFGHFNVHQEDCLTYSCVTDRPDRCLFSIQKSRSICTNTNVNNYLVQKYLLTLPKHSR